MMLMNDDDDDVWFMIVYVANTIGLLEFSDMQIILICLNLQPAESYVV